MAERDTVDADEIVRDFVAEIYAIPYVNTMASVISAKGEPTIYTLVPHISGRKLIDVVEKVVSAWAPIVEKHSMKLESIGIKVGPVLCEGQFNEFIEGSGELRKSQVLYNPSAA